MSPFYKNVDQTPKFVVIDKVR